MVQQELMTCEELKEYTSWICCETYPDIDEHEREAEREDHRAAPADAEHGRQHDGGRALVSLHCFCSLARVLRLRSPQHLRSFPATIARGLRRR